MTMNDNFRELSSNEAFGPSTFSQRVNISGFTKMEQEQLFYIFKHYNSGLKINILKPSIVSYRVHNYYQLVQSQFKLLKYRFTILLHQKTFH